MLTRRRCVQAGIDGAVMFIARCVVAGVVGVDVSALVVGVILGPAAVHAFETAAVADVSAFVRLKKLKSMLKCSALLFIFA